MVERGPDERVAGMLGRQPIRSRGNSASCSATLREGKCRRADVSVAAGLRAATPSLEAGVPAWPYGKDRPPNIATHGRGGARENGPRSRSFDSFLLLTDLGHAVTMAAGRRRRKGQPVALAGASHGITRSCLFALSIARRLHSTTLVCAGAVTSCNRCSARACHKGQIPHLLRQQS